MNFPPEYNGANNSNSVSFAPFVEKKHSVTDVSLKRSSLQAHTQNSGPGVWSRRPVENPSLALAAKKVYKRKKRVNWTKMEDNHVVILMNELGPYKPNWTRVANQLNETFQSTRTGKQCRERWLNHLRSDIKKGNWSSEEEHMIRFFYSSFGPKWSTMAKVMKDRTDNDIKNKWNSMKRSERLGSKREMPTIQATITGVGGISGVGRYNDMETFTCGGVPIESNQTPNNIPLFSEISGVGRHHEMQASTWGGVSTQPNQPTSNLAVFSAYRAQPSMHLLERAIAPMVTDGGSTENSPVPQKKYWGDSYEI